MLTLIDPNSDPLGAGYHIIQSKIAIGSGGFFRQGLVEWQSGSTGIPARTLHGLHFRRSSAKNSVCWARWPVLLIYLFHRRPRTGYRRDRPGYVLAVAGRQHQPDLLLLRIREHRHGHRARPSSRRAPAAGQRGRHIDGDPVGGFRYSHVYPDAPEATGTMIRTISIRPAPFDRSFRRPGRYGAVTADRGFRAGCRA